MTRPWDPGTEIDGFRVEQLLHTGSMAFIYRVRRSPAEPALAMKAPRLGHGEPAETLLSYEVEQMILSALKGPHVPRLITAGDLLRTAYLVMECIEGRALESWVDHAPVAPAELARLGAALATAVHQLHQQEAIHLDVKPSNVIIRPSGEAVLVDFGLARHAHYPDLLAEEFRKPIGSPPYISPEQILGERSDPRSDIFAIGVVLYELATGRLPFGAPSSMRGLRQRLHRDPVPPRALVPSIPEWLQEVILRCLEPDPKQRYASGAQIALDLSDPKQVTITERGQRLRRTSLFTRFKKWLRAAGREPVPSLKPSDQLASAPIIVVAVATRHTNPARFDALREAVRRAVTNHSETRLACVTVIYPTPSFGGSSEHESATSIHLAHLVQLRHWAEPLGLPPARVSFHVLESSDPATTLVEYARVNNADQIVIGAPPADMPSSQLARTVAFRVMREAPCTVTVVRAQGGSANS